MGLFKAGQLVSTMNWSEDSVPLHNMPGGAAAPKADSDLRSISWLSKRDVAMVIHVSGAGCRDVYVFGPNGGGWTFGAYLTIIAV